MKFHLGAILATALAYTACGYHVSGHADLIPKNIHTIAVPPFGNLTLRYKLGQEMPGALTRELLSRTHYKVVQDVNTADAVLTGSVITYNYFPTILDPTTGRASGVQISVNLQVTLRERATGKVLFQRPNFEAKERYQISTDQKAYFEESDTAIDRLTRDVARSVVSAILEAF